ncbi:MAG: hypothetical protein Q9164_003987 [Protoblastenia rupestris]
MQSAPWLVGFEGTLPAGQLEKIIAGNCDGVLSYEPSSTAFFEHEKLGRISLESSWIIEPNKYVRSPLPMGRRVFVLLDTGALTVSVFSAVRPPFVALIAGRESGMLRSALCYYERLNNCLYKKSVMRIDGITLDQAKTPSWIKLNLGNDFDDKPNSPAPEDNPLHISLFPPYETQKSALLEFSFLLNASLDIFDARCRDRNRVDQDLGLLQAIDERLSIWGWQTGTGARFAIIIDTWGQGGKPVIERKGTGEGKEVRSVAGRGVQDADVRPAFKALQTAYIRLLQNPFYTPDEHTPMAVAHGKGKSGEIKSKIFIREVRRIGELWKPGMSTI